jgi:dolichyl-diphosphooligosaccharide--protein glycosyltransferase
MLQRPAGTPAASNFALRLGLLLAVLLAAWATQTRLGQLSAWRQNPALYTAGGVPMMTTLDAYYALRAARLAAADQYQPGQPVPARHYLRPQPGTTDLWYAPAERVLPLLSRGLAAARRWFGIDIDRAGLLASPLLSSCFMLPLFLCAWRLGAPAAGLMGGLVTTFCIEYWQRTSAGWVDTDALNLFFPWALTACMLFVRAELSRLRMLLLSAATGTLLHLFFLWYEKPHLDLLFVAAFAGQLMLSRVGWRRGALCLVTLVVFANPLQFLGALTDLNGFLTNYLGGGVTSGPAADGGLHFPAVALTISEDEKLSMGDALAHILSRPAWSVLGLLACVPWLLRRWRLGAALAPVLLLGSLALLSSRRFLPYLAPFVGIGLGLLITWATEQLLLPWAARQGAAGRARFASRLQTCASCGAVLLVFAVALLPLTGRADPPRPAIPGPVFLGLQTLAHTLPAGSRLWTWWDLGYAIMDTTAFGIYHDGAAQYTPQTNVIAASLVLPEQAALHGLVRYVDREGNPGIAKVAKGAASVEDLLARLRRDAGPLGATPVFVLYTPDMLLKYGAMRRLSGLATAPGPAPDATSPGVRWLPCAGIRDELLQCAGQRFELRSGRILWPATLQHPPAAQLRRVLTIEQGRVTRERDYDADTSAPTLQIVLKDGALQAVYLLDEAAYASNLNQMFSLGRYDPALFEESGNGFPYARAFRVKALPD